MITITVRKQAVYKEVAKLASFADPKVTIGEESSLERFWREVCGAVTSGVLMYLTSVSSILDRDKEDPEEVFTLELTMPSNFDELFTTLIQEEIHSFFVNSLASKLLLISRKDVASRCEKQATSSLQNARRMLFYRKIPVRVLPTIE